MKSLLNRSLSRFIICTIVILLISMPLFYLLTKCFYAEDMTDLIESVKNGDGIPVSDMEQDILSGMMLQFALIIVVLSVASVVMMQWVSKRLWIPFEDTLKKTGEFNLEDPEIPVFMKTDIKEFHELDASLSRLMRRSSNQYREQKEFTENASHELQTPVAIIRGKLDVLLQEDLNEKQMEIVQEIYDVCNRMSRLNKNLLLLSKIDNSQYESREMVDFRKLSEEDITQISDLYGNKDCVHLSGGQCLVNANRPLSEILVNNLLVNAFRHIPDGGRIEVKFDDDSMTISNTAKGGALDPERIFNRFNHSSDPDRGNGIGLAIVKAICGYHHWDIRYSFENQMHVFKVIFVPSVQS